ncbi:putative xanthomonadin exporter protein [Thiorhodococcus drewsii AZ1]|uniref:Putative xanthomonadin exporter protein n=1 Tax=Thiorhodococcus drewsii AZ1 TaxID=765913 RepID=G2E4U3_9GAMM|nr:MMPL family transporter [Thiorhodococcus drewsii]EGV29114.1 putative xanthomonadin exporter protein [Thiorhodococcus drewsii AZ1]
MAPRMRLPRTGPLLAVWLLCLLLLMLWNLNQTTLHRDLSMFLPRTATLQEHLLLNQLREGIAARTLLIALQGDLDPERLADASRALSAALDASGRFRRVANGSETFEADALAPALAHRYLIGPREPCQMDLGTEGLRRALERRLDELAGPMPPIDTSLIARDPTGCLRALLLGLKPPTRPHQRHGVWVSQDGREALLLAETRAQASDLAAQAEAVTAVRTGFAALADSAQLHLAISGPGYFAIGSQETIQTQTTWLSAAASLVVATLLFAAFRSPRLVLIGALPLATGILIGTTAVVLTFGSIQGITLALGVTLMGVAMDYPVHIFVHTERRDGDIGGLSGIGPSLLLAVVTTVCGYAALALAEFEGLAQLGVLAGAGLASAAACSRFLLPALLPEPYRWKAPSALPGLLDRLPTLDSCPARLIALGLTGLLTALLALHPDPWSSDLSRLSTVPRSEIALDQRLRAELGAPEVAQILFVVGTNPEQVLQRIESSSTELNRLVDASLIAGFDTPTRILPSQATQRARQSELPTRDQLQRRLDQAVAGLPFRTGAFAPFLDDLDLAHAQTPLTPDDLKGTPIGERLETLLQPFDAEWVGLIPLIGADHPAAIAALQSLDPASGLRYLDLRETSAGLIDRFIRETLNSLTLAAALIGVLIWLGVRRQGRTLRVILPIALTLVLDYGLLLAIEGAINLFHLVSLLLVLGLSIDYSLFLSRRCADPAESARAAFAVALSALSSLLMFGLLALSSIPVLHAIGLTTALGIGLALPATFLLARPRRPSLSG